MERSLVADRLQAAVNAARTAGQNLLEKPLGTVERHDKGQSDVVTEMDAATERFLKSYLHQLFPTDDFLGEEEGREVHGGTGMWVIDPIDGTNNYTHDIPNYTISIGFEESPGKPILGVVYCPRQDELFHAAEGAGAYLNGKAISVSIVADPLQALTIISPPFRYPRYRADYFHVLSKLGSTTGDFRDFGSAALHLCYIACGRADAFFEYGLKYHDIAAAMVIVAEAGGAIAPIDEGRQVPLTGDIIVSNALLHDWYVHHIRAWLEENRNVPDKSEKTDTVLL
jgi:myo-inositol-1(or 4)-monophosphatase